MGLMDWGQKLAAQGRGGDSILAHINPREAMMLKMMGGSGTINPKTGLPQFGDYEDYITYVQGIEEKNQPWERGEFGATRINPSSYGQWLASNAPPPPPAAPTPTPYTPTVSGYDWAGEDKSGWEAANKKQQADYKLQSDAYNKQYPAVSPEDKKPQIIPTANLPYITTPTQGAAIRNVNQGYLEVPQIEAPPEDGGFADTRNFWGSLKPGDQVPIDDLGWYKIPEDAQNLRVPPGSYVNVLNGRFVPPGSPKPTSMGEGTEMDYDMSEGDKLFESPLSTMAWATKNLNPAMAFASEPKGGLLGLVGEVGKMYGAVGMGGGLEGMGAGASPDVLASATATPYEFGTGANVPTGIGSLGYSNPPGYIDQMLPPNRIGGLADDLTFANPSPLEYPIKGFGGMGYGGIGPLTSNLTSELTYGNPSLFNTEYQSPLQSGYWSNEEPFANMRNLYYQNNMPANIGASLRGWGPEDGTDWAGNPNGPPLEYAPPMEEVPPFRFGGEDPFGMTAFYNSLAYGKSPLAGTGYTSNLSPYWQNPGPFGGYPGFQNPGPGESIGGTSWYDDLSWGKVLKGLGKILPAAATVAKSGSGGGGGGGGEGGAGPKGGLLSLDEMPIPEYMKKKLKRKAMAAGKTWQEYLADATRGQKSYYGAYLA